MIKHFKFHLSHSIITEVKYEDGGRSGDQPPLARQLGEINVSRNGAPMETRHLRHKRVSRETRIPGSPVNSGDLKEMIFMGNQWN